MSNFVCSECGTHWIDCGDDGYKTSKEIELEQQVKRLQEQLADASKTIDYYDKKDFHYTLDDGTVMGAEPAHKYKIKWGVK